MFRLTKKSKLTKKKLRITNPYTKKKFTIKRKKKQVQIKRGKKVVAKYKVTKKGGLKKL